MSNARDHEARTAEIGDTSPLPEDTISRARITAAHHADSTEELAMFLRMLGIHPEQADDSTYVTRHPPLPTTAAAQKPLVNPLGTNYPHTPPRILRIPSDRNFGTQFRPLPNPKGHT